jgi:mannose-1-phosphate guanylyltransferase/mannose-6-phosphate isomerase
MDKPFFNPVIMAGGVGSRLWPLSRAAYPKQFQALVAPSENSSMLQQTIRRLRGLDLSHSQLICNQDHRFLAAEQVRQVVEQNSFAAASKGASFDIVLEPCSRNTAPAVLVTALRLRALDNDQPMLLLAADHAIADTKAFRGAVLKAHGLAEQDLIVTLGIKPTSACTGYGYIQTASEFSHGYRVAQFVEKPDESVAKQYLASGDYLWNSGMFIARPSALLTEAALHCPKLLEQCKKVVEQSFADLDFVRLPEEQFAPCDDISIDYAIMEHTDKAAVVPMDCGWSDVGDLAALKAANPHDNNGNMITGDVETMTTKNCLIYSSSRLVATLGVDNLAILETKDAVLVTDLARSQQVKDLLKKLSNREELDYHREVFRPWGSYDSVDHGENYQVKHITVNAGAKLSLQRHQYRAEHWVVVDGTATVHLDGEEHILETNHSIYIPKTAIHSLANHTDKPLHLIEVQSGSYLGEDDIERLEDLYGRER